MNRFILSAYTVDDTGKRTGAFYNLSDQIPLLRLKTQHRAFKGFEEVITYEKVNVDEYPS